MRRRGNRIASFTAAQDYHRRRLGTTVVAEVLRSPRRYSQLIHNPSVKPTVTLSEKK